MNNDDPTSVALSLSCGKTKRCKRPRRH